MKKLFFLVLFSTISIAGSYTQPLSTIVNSIQNKFNLLGGQLVVFKDEEIIENISFGKANINRDIAVDFNTKFRVASISKVVVAMAVMQQVDAKRIHLDADVSSILGFTLRNPNFPETPITPRMLLSNTSSIIDAPAYVRFARESYVAKPVPPLSELLTPNGKYYITALFLNSKPSEYYTYAGINYGILATMVEKVTNERFDSYCIDHIFKPLGIKASFKVDDLSQNEVGTIYRRVNGHWTPQMDDSNSVILPYPNLKAYPVGSNGVLFAPQSGLRISAGDLARFFMVITGRGSAFGKRIVSEEAVREMLSNQWEFNGSNGDNYGELFRSWGLGVHRITNTEGYDVIFSNRKQLFGHVGEAFGFIGHAFVDTTSRMGFVFLTNGLGYGLRFDSQSPFWDVERDVFRALERLYFREL